VSSVQRVACRVRSHIDQTSRRNENEIIYPPSFSQFISHPISIPSTPQPPSDHVTRYIRVPCTHVMSFVRTMTGTQTRSRREEREGSMSLCGQVSESCVSGICRAALLNSDVQHSDTAIEAVTRCILGRSTVRIQ
jgi:hypothetical protein